MYEGVGQALVVRRDPIIESFVVKCEYIHFFFIINLGSVLISYSTRSYMYNSSGLIAHGYIGIAM